MLKKTRAQDKKKRNRGSKLDTYREKIRALIDEYNLTAIRILIDTGKIGYDGGYTILKDYCHELRNDRRIQAAYRCETDPGKQSQVDFDGLGHDLLQQNLEHFSPVLESIRLNLLYFILVFFCFPLDVGKEFHLFHSEFLTGFPSSSEL